MPQIVEDAAVDCKRRGAHRALFDQQMLAHDLDGNLCKSSLTHPFALSRNGSHSRRATGGGEHHPSGDVSCGVVHRASCPECSPLP